MKFLICQASNDQMDNGGEYDLFKGKDGVFYNYEVEFDEDTVCISDTIGRMIPIDVEELDSLMFILNRINNYVKNTDKLNEFLYQKLIEDAST
jgi:hypothetical protein